MYSILRIAAMTNLAFAAQQERLQEGGKDVSAETSADALSSAASAVDSRTCIPRWRGEDCDYGMAIDALLRRGGRMSAIG
jgi:hypothetical protein